MIAVENTPVFHEHPGRQHSPQMELFDLCAYRFRYVVRRPPHRKRPQPQKDATQLMIDLGRLWEAKGD